MRVLLSEIEPGKELICYMRLGLALRKGRTAKGKVYMYVPSKPERTRANGLTRFRAWVITNDATDKIITMNITRMNSYRGPYNREMFHVQMHYSALQRVRLLSDTAFEAREQNPQRPTSQAIGTAFRAYRTITEVLIQ